VTRNQIDLDAGFVEGFEDAGLVHTRRAGSAQQHGRAESWGVFRHA
jgi:hypothetical protein